MTSPLRKLFQETSLDELCNQQNICILKDTASVEQALRVRNGLQHVLAMILLAYYTSPAPSRAHALCLLGRLGAVCCACSASLGSWGSGSCCEAFKANGCPTAVLLLCRH
jgi:hypothetical protein